MKIYLVMMWGDDYHGSFPVKAFHSKEEALKFARHEEENQVSSCGSETCTHKYMFVVHDVELSGESNDYAASNELSAQFRRLVS